MSSRGKNDGSVMINNTNVFALLGSKKKKKPKGKSSSAKSGVENAVEEKKVFWAPAPLNAKSWADVDDDDYYATTAPPQAVWGSTEQQMKEESPVHIEESESDEDILGEEEENYSEPETEENPEPVVKSFVPAIVVKEPERQLSKKEIRKKE
ncbi:hypothetical protein QQ045_003607 [Rhodiola kirilowii]